MVKTQQVEELFIDHKIAATDFSKYKLDPSDSKNLAKAISGFGNSEGGIIVWGVDCRPVDGIGDVPRWPLETKIQNTTMFKTLLDSAIGGSTLPAQRGVENIEIAYPNTTEGFVVTYVPQAMNVPLQTLVDKEEFYIRAGSSFRQTPRSVLAGLFGRRPQADFGIAVSLGKIQKGYPNRFAIISFEVYISNCGMAIAEDMFYNITARFGREAKLNVTPHPEISNSWKNLDSLRECGWTLISNFKLPPGSRKRFFDFSITLEGETSADNDVSISCGSSNSAGRAKAFRIPCDTVSEVYLNCVHDYPNDTARQNDERKSAQLITNCLDSLSE